MSVVSTANATTYGNANIVRANPILNLEPLDELATATVNNAPSYPVVAIIVTGTSADWDDVVENLLFRIERPDGTIICWGVTRKTATATVFYPDAKSAGDFGYATNSGLVILGNDIIRVYRNRHIWAMISRVGGGGVQYKRWNQAYNGEGRRPPPVINIGIDQTAYVDTTTLVAEFTFDANASYDWLLGSPGIVNYAWTLPTGAVVTGGAIDGPIVTFEIAAGIYQVSCTITSNNGVTATGSRTIYVNDLDNHLPFGEQFAIQTIQMDMVDKEGWQGQFTVLGDLTNQIYPGQKCLWYVPVTYDGNELTDNAAFLRTNVGYLTSYTLSYSQDGVFSTTLIFSSPLKTTKLLPSATQFIEEKSTPQSWTEIRPGLSDPAYAAFYILKFHTTVLDSHDFFHESAIRDLRRRVFGFPSDTVQSHLETVGVIMSGAVACRADGSINLYLDPNLQDSSGRDARDDKFTWTEDNLKAPLQMQPRLRPDIAYLIMRAVYFDGNTNIPAILYAAKAPGNAQMQGITKTDLPDISLSINSAAELYRVVGHWVAKLNNPLDKLVLQPLAMMDIFEPADPDWHIINLDDTTYIPADFNYFGVRWSSAVKYLPEQVNRQWSGDRRLGWTKTLRVSGRIESAGQPGVFLPTYRGERAPYIPPDGWVDGLDITMPDLAPTFNFDISMPSGSVGDPGYELGWAYNSNGISGVSTNWNSDTATWVSANTEISGDVISQTLDAQNPDAGYMVVWDAGNDELTVYYNSSVPADPTDWTAQVIIDVTTIGFAGRARILNSTAMTMLVVITETRTLVYRKPASGSWSSAVAVGDIATADPNGAAAEFGAALLGSTQVVPGRESTNDGYRLYKATTTGGAFTVIANTPGDNANSYTIFPMIARDGSGNTLVTFGTIGATFAGETRELTDSSSNPDMIENNTPSIPDRNWYPGYSTPWTEDVSWWSSSPGTADGVPAQYGRAIIFFTDENARGIVYTISTFEWRAETIALWYTASGSEANVDMIAEVRLLNQNKEILWTTGEIAYNTITDAVILETDFGWDTLFTRRRRGYEATATPDTPIQDVKYWELIFYSVNLETFSVLPGPLYNWPEFLCNYVGVPVGTGGGANDGSRIWTIDSKLQTGSILYSIDDATETWTEITPTDEGGNLRTPQRHNALAIASGVIYTIVTNADGQNQLIKSDDGGTTWLELGDTAYKWLRWLGSNNFAVGSDERLAVSINSLESFTTRLKKWPIIGTTGEILDFASGAMV